MATFPTHTLTCCVIIVLVSKFGAESDTLLVGDVPLPHVRLEVLHPSA